MPRIIERFTRLQQKDPVRAEQVRLEVLRILDETLIRDFLRECVRAYRRGQKRRKA